MSDLAALLILVACPSGDGGCLPDPVRVLSYVNPAICEERLPYEIEKAQRAGYLIYGSCNLVEARFLAGGRSIDITGNYEVELAAEKEHLDDRRTAGFAVAEGPGASDDLR